MKRGEFLAWIGIFSVLLGCLAACAWISFQRHQTHVTARAAGPATDG
jgi:hypothetical protein